MSANCHARRLESRLLLFAAASCSLLAACGTQAPPEYYGEALLQLSGAVEITENRLDGPLVPAIGFFDGDDLFIADVEVEGEFPSKFELSLFVSPPKASLFKIANLPGEPEIAVGYLTAVTADHPERARYGASESVSGGCSESECVTTRSWCSSDDSTCYSEIEVCSGEPEMCTVTERTGDPVLKTELWSYFAGLSRNYVIAYLTQAAPKSSVTAHLFGRAGGLSAGYHLIAISEPTEADDVERAKCWREAEALVKTRFNEAHETQGYDPAAGECGNKECPEAWIDEVSVLTLKARAELDCPHDNFKWVPAPNAETERITVVIDPNVRPLGA